MRIFKYSARIVLKIEREYGVFGVLFLFLLSSFIFVNMAPFFNSFAKLVNVEVLYLTPIFFLISLYPFVIIFYSMLLLHDKFSIIKLLSGNKKSSMKAYLEKISKK